MISAQQKQEVEDRIKATESDREENIRKLKRGGVQAVNSPEQVQRRFDRIEEASRVVTATQAEAGASEEFLIEGLPRTSLAVPAVPNVPDMPVMPEADPETAKERLINKSDLMPVNYLEIGLRIARTVGRVNVRNSAGMELEYGTGFMISPRLLMTNNHVLPDQASAATSQVEFNDQLSIRGKMLPGVYFDLRPDVFFLTDEHLDYTLVEVAEQSADGNRSLQEYGWNVMIEDTGKVLVGEYLSIIQHPNAEPKQLALRENQLVLLNDDFMQYLTDTQPGSSGSPVYNDQWEVVGLHHQGVPRTDSQGRVLNKQGQIWKSSMGENAKDWIANEGIRISRIIDHVRNRPLTGAAKEALRAEMLRTNVIPFVLQDELRLAAEALIAPRGADALPQPDNVNMGNIDNIDNMGCAVTPNLDGQQAGQGWGQMAGTGGDDAATWNIPIQVSVRLGQPQMWMADVGDGAQGGREQPAVGMTTVATKDRELQEALDKLAEASRRPYYDAAQDRRDRDRHYASKPTTTDPASLYDWLHNLLESTHTHRPRYQPATQLYPLVDLHPSLKLESIYSGQIFAPEMFIREDFEIEQWRQQRIEAMRAETGRSEESLQAEIDNLEANLPPFNCEHVVPQSWFNKEEPMRGDLHHLFACERRCNSFRQNTPYFDFDDFEAIRAFCGKSENNRFEPKANKGPVSRAVLYFLLRYPGLVNKIIPAYDQEGIATLIGWHKDQSVSNYEKHRNMTIFATQGNRNPLIDYPDWVDGIDFARGLA